MLTDKNKERETKTYRIGGQPQAQSYRNLEPGTYYLVFRVANPSEVRCELQGTIDIRIT